MLTNPETGKFAVQSGHRVYKEIKATHVEGDIYSFRVHDAGVPYTLQNSDGDVVVRDRGLVVWEDLFDTKGDGEPGGEGLEFNLVSTHGPHSALSWTDEQYCAQLADLIG